MEFHVQKFKTILQYVNLSQQGENGFFGRNDIDRSTTGDFANANFWPGFGTVTGSDAATSFYLLYAYPVVKVNKAISVHSDLFIGPYFSGTNPGLRWTPVSANAIRSPDQPATISTIVFGNAWVEFETPIGRLYLGKKPFGKACGLQYAATNRDWDMWQLGRSEEYVELEVSRGPLIYNLGVYPWRISATTAYIDAGHKQLYDRNAARTLDLYGSLTYQSGNLETGAGAIFTNSHEGPESQDLAVLRASFVPRDVTTNEGWAYLKYSDGRFFFNVEGDWYHSTDRRCRSLDGTFAGIPDPPFPAGGSQFATRYIESWRYMAEVGVIAGPSKWSFLWSYIPGPDQRHGVLIDRQPFLQGQATSAAAVFIPYATMMNLFYRSGNNAFFDLSDSRVLAGRVDYALATNLQVWASVLHARRASRSGYSWGFIKPHSPGNVDSVQYAQTGTFTAPAPSVPNDVIGTEMNVGVRWVLLEDWMLKVTGGYFWPGNWWNFACIDKSVPAWDTQVGGATAYPFGTNPQRTIDPVGMLRVEFWVGL